jgi:transposase
MAKSSAPQVVELGTAQLEALLVQLAGLLPADTYQLVETLLRTLQWVTGALEAKNTTLGRLRRMLFGAKTEKSRHLLAPSDAAATGAKPPAPKPKAKGHGRKAAQDYPGAKRRPVPHPKLHLGDLCPKCLQGKLYLLKTPARIVRIAAQPIFNATVFELERLRCALCGTLFTAPAPPEAGPGKYDPSCGVMLNLQRFGVGQPMYRTDKWQSYFGVPLAASTQWQLMAAAAHTPALVYEALIQAAAQAELLHNDDTPMRVQSLRRDIIARQDPDQRTGIFTTGIIAQVGPVSVALFFTGQNHAGENLNQLLKSRAADLAQPLQMCDALSRNEPQAFQTLLCHCLLHARRNFIDVRESFPEECGQVITSLREIYRFEAQAKERKLSPLERLHFHQEHSQPVMDQLQQWMQAQLDQKNVEPNSGLGQAIHYMLKRWETLTRFLSTPGAPLDNNITERALKTAILHRKNSLSYKTLAGARVGDIHMSLIHTCALNKVNPFDYLMALDQHAEAVTKEPAGWFPWNYRQALEAANST